MSPLVAAPHRLDLLAVAHEDTVRRPADALPRERPRDGVRAPYQVEQHRPQPRDHHHGDGGGDQRYTSRAHVEQQEDTNENSACTLRSELQYARRRVVLRCDVVVCAIVTVYIYYQAEAELPS